MLHWEFSGSLPNYTILETFKSYKEVKHIMITIIALIYIYFILCDTYQHLKITFRKSSAPLTKSIPPSQKFNLKSVSTPRLAQCFNGRLCFNN